MRTLALHSVLSAVPLLVGALLAPSTASAETVCTLALRGNLPEPAAADVSVAFHRGLVGEGDRLVPLADDAAALAEPLLACDGPACVDLGLAALGCDVLAAPSAWRTPDGVELGVSLVGAAGVPVELRDEAPSPRAAALAERLAGRAHDRIPTLATRTTPAHAAEDAAHRRARSPVNVAVGVGLLATALVPLGFAGRAVVRDGECADPTADGRCPVDARGRYEVISFGPRSIGLFAVGGALAASGTFFLAARPVRVRLEGERGVVRLTVGTVL